jgi:hypothetical protein
MPCATQTYLTRLVRRKAVATETGNDDDPELERTEVDIKALRVQKEQRLQDLERGERELSKVIAEKSGSNMSGNLGQSEMSLQ